MPKTSEDITNISIKNNYPDNIIWDKKKWFSEQELKDKLKAEYQKGIKDGAEGIKAQLEMWKISKLKKAEMQWLR
mgnify:FL=1